MDDEDSQTLEQVWKHSWHAARYLLEKFGVQGEEVGSQTLREGSVGGFTCSCRNRDKGNV